MGVRGPQRQPGALRREGWQPPRLPAAMKRLAKAIVARRGGSISHHVMLALMQYANVEEIEDAGMLEE